MANAIATTKTHSLAPLPELEPSLELAVKNALIAPHDGHRVPPPAPSSAMVTLAKASIPAVIASTGPVHPDLLKSWLQRLANALPIGGAKDDPNRARHAVAAIAEACGEFPAECFTAATLKTVLQRCEFFPTGAKLFEILDPVNCQVKAKVAEIRRIANYIAPPPEVPVATPEERAEVAQKMQAFAAEMAAKMVEIEGDKMKITPIHVSKLNLALAEHARGVPINRMRPDLRAALEQHREDLQRLQSEEMSRA